MEMKEKVLQSGHFLFDNKPMIVKEWTKDLELSKADVKSVPAWIRMHNLPIKFWGKGLPKIANLFGEYVKSDQATEERTRFGFARVMVELVVDQHLLNFVSFKDKKGSVVKVEVEYEWRYVTCSKCHGMGHEGAQYKRGDQKKKGRVVTKKVWRPIAKKAYEELVVVPAPDEVVQVAHSPGRASLRSSNLLKSPVKQLSILNRRGDETGGYSNEEFGANPYKEVQGPWAIAGDFNCVLAASKRFEGATSAAEKEPFRRCIEDCEVVDIAAIGSLYTWNNKQRPEERIYSRIDRFLVNKDWCDHFPDKYAHFLPEGLFDHSSCLVRSANSVQGKRNFKYLNMWGSSKEFLPTVRQSWDRSIEGTLVYKLATNLKKLKASLLQLNREAFSDIDMTTGILQKEVQELQKQLEITLLISSCCRRNMRPLRNLKSRVWLGTVFSIKRQRVFGLRRVTQTVLTFTILSSRGEIRIE
ncbi:uncharacterized protein LOC141649038 [Silene latifolia]|uniref:uncharacterized protein LOC141649038 n=1 Tax=Silene latifolia TaxID=37657 RepID=UPI003D771C77